MPRKKKIETIESSKEEKKATKKKTTQKKVPDTMFDIAEMAAWSDEECKVKDKELKFKVADVRNILRSIVTLNKDLKEAQDKLNLVRITLARGLMTGYKVVCPHCGREYIVNSMELNRKSKVTCKVCGTEYKEDENIDGITVASDNDEVTQI